MSPVGTEPEEVTLADFLRHRHKTSNVGLLLKHLDADTFETLVELFGGTTVVFPEKLEIHRDFRDYDIVMSLRSGVVTQEILAEKYHMNQSTVCRTAAEVEEELSVIVRRRQYIRDKHGLDI